MKVALSIALLTIALIGKPPMTSKYECLPEDLTQDSAVEYRSVTDIRGEARRQKVTVKETLDALGARCKGGKLIDTKGREIRFVRLQGCWGNPPADYQEILDEQAKQIEMLKREYTVIEMTCETEWPAYVRP